MRGSYCSVCMQAHPPVSFAYLRLITLPRQPHLFIREGRKQADSTHTNTHTHTHPTGSIAFITTSSTHTHTHVICVLSHWINVPVQMYTCSLSSFLSLIHKSLLSLSPASRRARGDYYVNECERRRGEGGGREGGRGVRLSVRGVLLFLFSLSPSIAPRITAISTPEEYFNIRYSTPPLPSAPPIPDSCWETQRETERERERERERRERERERGEKMNRNELGREGSEA